jgi:hypothetical protein
MTCAERSLIDAHFAARGRPAVARRMFAHLGACDKCRRYYRRHLVLATIDPAALSVEARTAAALGLRAPRRAGWLVVGTLAMTAASLLLLLRAPAPSFVARGGAPVNVLQLYRVHAGARPERVEPGARIARDDELAFAYVNPERRARLMIFAMDEHGHVYWYHPAWTDAATNPQAVAVAPSDRPIELGEAVAHAIDARTVTLYALFTDNAPTVREVERAIARGELERLAGRLLRYRLELE